MLNRGRVLQLAGIVGLGVVIMAAVASVLPATVRRVALDQISRRTGRTATIEDIRFNPLTGRLSVRELRLAERDGAQTFLELPRLDMRFVVSALLRRDIRVAELALVAPSVRVVRTKSGEFNFSDLLPRGASPRRASKAPPSRWTVTVDRLTIANGAMHAHDEAVTPPTAWEVRPLDLELDHLTTRPGAGPARGVSRAQIDEAKLDLTGEGVRLDPLAAVVRIRLDGFELRRLGPYLSHVNAPYRVKGGRVAAALTATVDHKGDELAKATLSGTVSVEGEAVARSGQDDPFLEIPHAVVNVKEADAITRSLTIASAAIDGAELRARRDTRGIIDLVEVFSTTAPTAARPDSAAPAPPPTVSRRLVAAVGALAHGFERIDVERVTLGSSTVTLVDEAVKPTTTLTLTQMRTTMTDFTWPPKGPAALELSAMLPGDGALHVKGPLVLRPFNADFAVSLRNASIEPYHAYVPGRAQILGRFSGDSRTRIALRDGTIRFASTGNSWAQGFGIRGPDARRPAIRVERMELAGIDFEWPRRARIAKATFRNPDVEIVREADGTFDVTKLFAPPASPGGKRPKGPLEIMELTFKKVRVEDGLVRFLDRTTSPAFSKDLSKLTVEVDDLSNRAGQRARLSVKSMVVGGSPLDLRGEFGPIGSPALVDLVGELDSLPLAAFNPYAEAALGWVIKQGHLQHTMHFTLDGDALDVTNDIVLGQLRVAPSGSADEVNRQIGLPLGLLVRLATDDRGEIRATVPVSGSIHDPNFDVRRLIRTSLRRAVARVVRAPFRAISRAPRDENTAEVPTVDPVTFAPGSVVISPDMEQHLLRVADALRHSPLVNLALAPAPGAADVEALKAEALNAKLYAFQAEHRLSNGPGVVAAYFAKRFPEMEPPAAVEKQLVLLREREPAPEGPLNDLSRRRVDATRERLISVEGIPAERLVIGAPQSDAAPPPPAGGGGGVELEIVAGGE